MLEKYYKYKCTYKNYLLLIKCGNFYETIDRDALIMNIIFDYKIKKVSNTFKSGFPVIKIKDIVNKLKENDINYVVIDSEISEVYDLKEKNKYLEYDVDTNKVMLNYIRIDKIINYLNNHVLEKNIDDILCEMEKLL